MAIEFDEAELLDRIDGDIAFLAETVGMLATDGRALMEDVFRAAVAGDGAALGRSAHALKGMISNFCAPKTQGLAFELERMGKSGDLGAAPEIVRRLQERLAALTGELGEFVKARS
ncbi:MAG: Hpt domain-containing protein [Phycisphaeraceae bacterium]|nr:Hpt domain-containing protein [Phycisphaeraceae bacterium]